MRDNLTEKQKNFFEYLKQVVGKTGAAPSLRAAAGELGISHAAVAQMLKMLEDKGYIKREGRYSRTIHILNQMGEAVGLTFQQIQKYERGANRIGASRMYDLAHVLDVPVAFFFEDIPDEVKKRDDTPQDSLGVHTLEEADKDPLTRRETLELVRAYYKVGNAAVRKRVFELIKSLAKMDGDI